jgi:CheY-like chemotaxis protein
MLKLLKRSSLNPQIIHIQVMGWLSEQDIADVEQMLKDVFEVPQEEAYLIWDFSQAYSSIYQIWKHIHTVCVSYTEIQRRYPGCRLYAVLVLRERQELLGIAEAMLAQFQQSFPIFKQSEDAMGHIRQQQDIKHKVLILEDDLACSELLQTWLLKAGFDCLLFNHPQDLLDVLCQPSILPGLPSLFLIDYHLPTIDGFKVTSHLRAMEATKDIPVIILTADTYVQAQAMNSGADTFLTKPIKRASLLQAVTRLLETVETSVKFK